MHNNHDTKTKPSFSTWDRANLERLAHDLWDQNQALRTANEQLRLDRVDAMKLARRNIEYWA